MKNRASAGVLWILGLVLYLVLLDVAVEAAVWGSIVRISAIAAVLVYTALVGLLWERLDLAVRVELAALIFCGLVAQSGWSLGSLTAPKGLTLLGISADAVAAGLELALLAGAVVALVAARAPWWLTAIATLLAVYAALPITLALIHGAGLAAALAGNGALPADPVWIRGAFLAANALLPLATLAALALALVSVVRRRATAGLRYLVAAVVFALGTQVVGLEAYAGGLPAVLALHGNAVPGSVHVAAAGGALGGGGTSGGGISGSGGASASNGSGAGSSGLDASIAPETGELFAPKDAGDVSPEVTAAFANLPKDPQHALQAVAALHDDLYPGALAGAVGALRAREANSIDKALLLRDVLRTTMPSVTTAFARCTLPGAQADALVAQARTAANHPKILLQGAASSHASDPKLVALAARWAATWKSLVAQTQSDGGKLAESLHAAGLELPAGATAADRLRALAAPHVWLRAQVNGASVDLDPTIVPAAPGATRCTPDSVTAALPDDLYDVLGVRVVAETQSGGTLQRATVLDRTVRTADLGARGVSFMFAEPTGSDDASPAPAAVGMNAFTPLLRVGEESISGTPLALPVPAAAGPGAAAAMKKGLKSAISAFDTSATDAPSAAPTATSAAASSPVLTAVFLELSVASPGNDTTRARSPVFDRIGYAARASGTAPAAVALDPGAGVYRSMQSIWNVAVSGGHTVSGSGPAGPVAGKDGSGVGAALARLNGAYYSLRRALMDDARGSGIDVGAERPGISLLEMNNDGGLMADIASDASLPLTADESRPTWAVAAELAERHLIGDASPNSAAVPDALAVFEKVAAANLPPIGLRPGATATPPGELPADARVRIADHISGGASVLAMPIAVAQSGGIPYPYWVLDPASGTLRDENSLGRHQELEEEEVQTEEVAIKPASKWKQLACRIAVGIMIAVTDDSSAAEGKTFEDAMAEVEKATEKEGGTGEEC